MSISRRGFVIGGGISLAALGGLLSVPLWRGTPGAIEPLRPSRFGASALAVLAQLEGTDAIAQAFLADQGGTVATLEEGLVARLRIADPVSVAADDLVARLQQAVAEDFRSGRLCTVTDWMLSETECQVAALRYLLFGPSADGDDDVSQWQSGTIVAVTNWGPQETQQDLAVNVQADGHSGLWFQAEHAPDWLMLQIGEDVVPTVVSDVLITSGLYGSLQDKILSVPGRYEVALLDPMRRIRQPLGHFVVALRPAFTTLADGSASTAFCAQDDWGPQEARVGEVPNAQPDGSAGIWIRIGCAAAGTRVLFDGVALATTVQPELVTARIPAAMFSVAREAQLALHDPVSGDTLPLGIMSIRDD